MKKFCWRVSSQIIGVSRQFSASSHTKYGKCDSEFTACLDMIGLKWQFFNLRVNPFHAMPIIVVLLGLAIPTCIILVDFNIIIVVVDSFLIIVIVIDPFTL